VPQPRRASDTAARSRPPDHRPEREQARVTWPKGTLVVMGVAGLLLAAGIVVLVRPMLATDDVPETTPDDGPVEVFAPPVALGPNASYVETRVLPSGELRVRHWIRSTVALFSLTLTSPVLDGLPSEEVVAKEVEVRADGRMVEGARSVRGRSQNYQFFGARSIEVSYLLIGAVDRSSSERPTVQARVTALDLGYVSLGGRSTRVVEGAEVVGLTCSSTTGSGPPVPCGSPDADGHWQVVLRGDHRRDRVGAELDVD